MEEFYGKMQNSSRTKLEVAPDSQSSKRTGNFAKKGQMKRATKDAEGALQIEKKSRRRKGKNILPESLSAKGWGGERRAEKWIFRKMKDPKSTFLSFQEHQKKTQNRHRGTQPFEN